MHLMYNQGRISNSSDYIEEGWFIGKHHFYITTYKIVCDWCLMDSRSYWSKVVLILQHLTKWI